MSHHKIEARNLHFTYPDGREAIRDLSFQILHGESVGIIGANGAGKSTLLLLLLGLLWPDRGDVLVGDVRLTKRTLPLIRQRLGLVFQDPDDQLFMPTVYDDVAFGPRNYQLDEKEVADRVRQALESVGVSHLQDRSSARLSGGEKRAAAIAAVLAMQPDVLLLDEPTAALDARARRQVINLLHTFSHTRIVTSHDLDLIYATCQRVLVIHEGKIAADGRTTDILTDEKMLAQCGLEMPLALQNCPRCGAAKPGHGSSK